MWGVWGRGGKGGRGERRGEGRRKEERGTRWGEEGRRGWGRAGCLVKATATDESYNRALHDALPVDGPDEVHL